MSSSIRQVFSSYRRLPLISLYNIANILTPWEHACGCGLRASLLHCIVCPLPHPTPPPLSPFFLSFPLSPSLPPSPSLHPSLLPSLLSSRPLPLAPSEPQNLMISGVGAGALLASWTAPADNGGRPLSSYRIIIDSIGFSQMIPVPGMTSLLIRDSQLVENTTYT